MIKLPAWGRKVVADRSPGLLADAPRAGREHFIPLRHQTLLEMLWFQPELAPLERCQLRQLAAIMQRLIHDELHRRWLTLTRTYTPFDPDDDTCSAENYSEEELCSLQREFFDTLKEVLRCGNYQPLPRIEVENALEVVSEWGLRLHVDFSVFDRLEVYARGDILGKQKIRPWYKLFRVVEKPVPMYQRLVVIFSLRHTCGLEADVDTDAIYLKLFKNIPKADVDMLLPSSRIRLTLVDCGKIILPTLSGVIATIVKIVKGAVLAALTGTIWGILAFLGFVIGTIGYGVRSFFGYLHTKDKYQLHLTRNLYYQNLDNNAGVFYRLLDDAEEQELREMLIAYYALWKWAGPHGWTLDELDRAAEQFLQRMLNMQVDFEVDDAVAKLKKYHMVEDREDGRLLAVAAEEVCRRWASRVGTDPAL